MKFIVNEGFCVNLQVMTSCMQFTLQKIIHPSNLKCLYYFENNNWMWMSKAWRRRRSYLETSISMTTEYLCL